MNRRNGNAAIATIEKPPALEQTCAVILAHAVSRIEGGQRQPAVLLEIGGRPVLWHLMRQLASFGLRRFAVVVGSQGDSVRRCLGEIEAEAPDWQVKAIESTDGAELVRRCGEGAYLLANGRSLSDIDLRALHDYHVKRHCLVTVAAVRPPARFGAIDLAGNRVVEFAEKPELSEAWRSGGIYLLDAAVLAKAADITAWEETALEGLAAAGKMAAYQHAGYWQALETLRDKQQVEERWQNGSAPWNTWREHL